MWRIDVQFILSGSILVLTVYGLIFFKIFLTNLIFLVKKLQHSKNKFKSPIFELKNPIKVSKKDKNSVIKTDFGFFYLKKSKTNRVRL
jgi:hypothetical protein